MFEAGGVCDITSLDQGAAAQGNDFLGCGTSLFFVVASGHDVGTCLREGASDFETDSAGSTGDGRCLVCQVENRIPHAQCSFGSKLAER